ncbi:NAD(P)-binding domain-containing protein [Methylobrevis albus]|uniref:NAD(P)-binding domain-containing protein n=1 Tax=Methylobrevis albus TaxID=2793297 RepID=A0A931MZ85_9HYPH|nr:NAD(P)-binding domain-containing protein [Methylobrevis albus]MBH0238780.1 NAD(P)-binding domain-containing protein [Methylobrevis albus]
MLRLGFVGTGTLAAAVIGGLEETHAGRVAILVSPRSEAISTALAAAHADVTRAASSAAVVEGSDVVFLGMRPNQLGEATAGLPFREDQTVVSFLAGVPLDVVRAAVAPAAAVVRVNPLPPIRFRKGPVVQYPANPVVEDLFSGLGDLVVATREADLHAIGIASALMSSHYEMQNRVVAWLLKRGMAEDAATAYVRSMYDGLAEVTLQALAAGETVDPAHHETRGGLNEHGRARFRETGWFDAVEATLESIAAHAERLRKPEKVD